MGLFSSSDKGKDAREAKAAKVAKARKEREEWERDMRKSAAKRGLPAYRPLGTKASWWKAK